MLGVGKGCTGQLPTVLIGVRALHPQPTLHLHALIEGLRLFAHIPIGMNYPLNAGFHHLRLFSQGLPRGDVDAVGTPPGIMDCYNEQITETLSSKRLRILWVLEGGIDEAGE